MRWITQREHLVQLLLPTGSEYDPHRDGVWLVCQPCSSLSDFVSKTEQGLNDFISNSFPTWDWSEKSMSHQIGAWRLRFGVGVDGKFDPQLLKEFTLLGLQASTFGPYFSQSAVCLFQ